MVAKESAVEVDEPSPHRDISLAGLGRPAKIGDCESQVVLHCLRDLLAQQSVTDILAKEVRTPRSCSGAGAFKVLISCITSVRPPSAIATTCIHEMKSPAPPRAKT